ncbi:hypothetical protein LOAG_06682 [Loa loa]|uniref:Uncharacterized protein n=1 Tax=Loa loa TaxID=7209 RepID=A0A1S0TZ46_LOALO|nr:hypothetical protein LOAG_06682 [Loa loa]EFO21806.1 hypothetical protein LOAG_06682 [Loa loa]
MRHGFLMILLTGKVSLSHDPFQKELQSVSRDGYGVLWISTSKVNNFSFPCQRSKVPVNFQNIKQRTQIKWIRVSLHSDDSVLNIFGVERVEISVIALMQFIVLFQKICCKLRFVLDKMLISLLNYRLLITIVLSEHSPRKYGSLIDLDWSSRTISIHNTETFIREDHIENWQNIASLSLPILPC